MAHKRHRAVVNNNSHNLHLLGAMEANHMVKAQIILKMVGNQMTKMVRQKPPVRASAKAVVVATVVVVTATAVVTAVTPAGVLLIPAAAKPSKNTSTGVSERNATKRRNLNAHQCRSTQESVPGKTQCSKTQTLRQVDQTT